MRERRISLWLKDGLHLKLHTFFPVDRLLPKTGRFSSFAMLRYGMSRFWDSVLCAGFQRTEPYNGTECWLLILTYLSTLHGINENVPVPQPDFSTRLTTMPENP